MSSQVIRVDGLRSLAAGSISGTYTQIGTGFAHPMRIVKVVNNTNGDLTISFDGVNDNDFVPANSFTLYDCTTNRVSSQYTFVFAKGTAIFVKGTPSTGSVYCVCIYGTGE
jgi:hypothetical protein